MSEAMKQEKELCASDACHRDDESFERRDEDESVIPVHAMSERVAACSPRRTPSTA